MTTARSVFDKAIKLAGENDEKTGATLTRDTEEYEKRTIEILNVLRGELYPYSDTFEHGENGRRGVCPEIKTMDQILDLDDVVAQTIMPYGLAAHLLLDDNPSMANFFQQRYQELLYTLGSRRPAVWEDIPVDAWW